MVEDMLRLALFLLFLRAHPNICIHVRIRNLHTDYLSVLCRVTQSSSPSRVPSQMCASPKSSRVFLLMDQVESKSELLLSRVESSRVKVVLSIGLWAIL